ncbi:VOC family protein [Streptomyces piniterrae]|uniref:VOC family protein n=1 Tax=Streptomyces piniterrae TaxID=2571125 RepID=A0A4U0NJM0_9ACTN|nr:VOC family protein [Streptomyces piniterrae]TJZ54283.1 VOC family protein [Streptomyces piniterrae]
MTEKTIPILPCHEIQPVVDFYTALGFETTFRQKSPYPYAVVERGPVQLQFSGIKGYDPAGSYSACYIVTDHVDGLYATFREGLKAAYGKIPTRGLPRIGPLKNMSYGMRQFLMTDPGGNSIRVGQQISEDQSLRPVPKETFARAVHMADLFVDSKQDLPGAAKIIDHALRLEGEHPTPAQHLRLLVLRGDIAQRLGDDALAARLLTQAAELQLSEEERASASEALARLAELRSSTYR